MNRQSFAILLNKYLNGECSDEEQQIVEQWYDLLEEIPDSKWNIKELEEKLWQKIKGQVFEEETEVVSLSFWQNNRFRIGNIGMIKNSILGYKFFIACG